jgi:hypothetical protein
LLIDKLRYSVATSVVLEIFIAEGDIGGGKKNDSGVASGSDFHSSSPGSDNSQDQPYQRTPQAHTGTFYSAPMIPQSYGVNPLDTIL